MKQMNQTKIEIKSCEICPLFIEGDIFGGMFSGCSNKCNKYDIPLPDIVSKGFKPDFCKVKNIIVEEE